MLCQFLLPLLPPVPEEGSDRERLCSSCLLMIMEMDEKEEIK